MSAKVLDISRRTFLIRSFHSRGTYEAASESPNRSLVSLKRYFGWAMQRQIIHYDPSAPIKLVGQEDVPPRHLDDQEEQAVVAAVTKEGTLRDRVLIVLLLYTGLRAREICHLRRDQVKLGKRSGTLEVIGKRNKYHEVPLNTTARKVLEEYLTTLPSQSIWLFLLARQKRPCRNVPLATLSKSVLMQRNSPL